MAKFIPNWNCYYWASQQTELTQSEIPPTAITDSVITILRNMEHKELNMAKTAQVNQLVQPLNVICKSFT